MSTADRSPVLALCVAATILLSAGPLFGLAGVTPAPLTGQWDTMLRYDELRRTVRREGANDVVFVGSSIFRRGVVPDAVSGEIAARVAAKRGPRVFTFGAPGHSVLTYPLLVDLILGHDRPQLVVMLLSPRSIDRNAARLNRWSATVAKSPYARAIDDRYTLRGWLGRSLLDYSPLSRFAPTLRSYALGTPQARDGVAATERGYVPMERKKILPAMRERQREVMRDWETDERFVAALDRAVSEVRSAGADVLLVDAPRSAAMLELMAEPDRNIGGMRRFADEAQLRLDVPVVYAPAGLVPEAEYSDLAHYTPAGAEIYSRWLAVEIAQRFPTLRFD